MKTLILLFASIVSLFAQPQPISTRGTIPWTSIAILPATTGNLTARQMVGITQATITGAATLTSPSATVLCTLWPWLSSSRSGSYTWEWVLRNTAASSISITIAGGSGVTTSGTMTIAQNAARNFVVSITGCGATPAAVIYSTGSYTF